MHLGTSIAIVLFFNIFSDMCGPKKPPEPPPPAPDYSENRRKVFERTHEMFTPHFKESLPKIELLEAEYQDQDKALSAKARAMAMYSVVVKQHDDLVARTEALKAAFDAWNTYYEEHKQTATNEEHRKLADDAGAAQSEGNKLNSDYHSLNAKLRQIESEAR